MNCIGLLTFVLGAQMAFGATKADCMNGNFEACKKIINDYGSTSDKAGAIDFFESACSSQNLNIYCQIVLVKQAETLKRSLELARKSSSAQFIITGEKLSKIYLISSSEK